MKISLTLAFLTGLLLCCACAHSRPAGGRGNAAVACTLPLHTFDHQPPSQPDYRQVLAAPGPF